ncbi:MAG TPA: alpha/beta-type small acid-soluble spore protein [Bacillota bacterium]|nr:alpha/beta-type small acid-soluble spore protein [Bacillota bacterium]
MANNTRSPQVLPRSVLDQFKYEIANEIGITPQIQNGYWGQVKAEDCGRVGGSIGGNMVKLMIRRSEEELIKRYGG